MTRRILMLALLLLINGILFGAILGLPWLPQQPGAREPERMTRQQHREAIEIMRAKTSNVPDAPNAPDAPDASEAPSAAVSQGTTTDTATDQRCVELGSWTAAQLRAAEDDLAKLRSSYPDAQIAQVERRDTGRLWVRLPSFQSRSDAEQAVADLGRRQIDDVSIVTDSAQGTYTVSLGVFRDPVRAERHLAGLKTKGVQRAIITPDPRAPSRIWLQISHQADAAMEAQLEGLRKRYRLNALVDCAG